VKNLRPIYITMLATAGWVGKVFHPLQNFSIDSFFAIILPVVNFPTTMRISNWHWSRPLGHRTQSSEGERIAFLRISCNEPLFTYLCSSRFRNVNLLVFQRDSLTKKHPCPKSALLLPYDIVSATVGYYILTTAVDPS